ncbi:hypothetical protein D9M68_718250 [compost metagenome]
MPQRVLPTAKAPRILSPMEPCDRLGTTGVVCDWIISWPSVRGLRAGSRTGWATGSSMLGASGEALSPDDWGQAPQWLAIARRGVESSTTRSGRTDGEGERRGLPTGWAVNASMGVYLILEIVMSRQGVALQESREAKRAGSSSGRSGESLWRKSMLRSDRKTVNSITGLLFVNRTQN